MNKSDLLLNESNGGKETHIQTRRTETKVKLYLQIICFSLGSFESRWNVAFVNLFLKYFTFCNFS